MCEHNPRNTGASYCAYCEVTNLRIKLARIVDLHFPTFEDDVYICGYCKIYYPCETIQKIDD